MIAVRNEVTIYEVDGKERADVPPPLLIVHSHWNRDALVVLEVAGTRVTVSAADLNAAIAADLNAAIANATNTRRIGS